MASLIPGYEYDIFISYRHKDNKYDGWVSAFVHNLRRELGATFKEDISIYFDENAGDGILETHDVDESLSAKLKCLVFIPIVSQTYCDPNSFAWKNELQAFNKMIADDAFGRSIKLPRGNVASRILPVQIHHLEEEDKLRFEDETGGVLRAVEFIYYTSGVNRPLRPLEEHPHENQNQTIYRDQLNKTANAIKEVISGIKSKHRQPHPFKSEETIQEIAQQPLPQPTSKLKILAWVSIFAVVLLLVYFYIKQPGPGIEEGKLLSIAVLPFEDLSEQKDQGYLGEGIAEGVLNALTHANKLKVINRTSSFSFKDKGADLRAVGEILGVKNVLEGTVKRDGDKVIVTAKLTNVDDGARYWSETYSRDERNIFDIQGKIATDICNELHVALTSNGHHSEGTPLNPAAYEMLLKGNMYFAEGATGLLKSIEYYNQAIALEPTYAHPYIQLGWAYDQLTLRNGFEPRDGFSRAKEVIEKSIALKTTPLLEKSAYSCLAFVHLWQFEWEKGLTAYQESLQLDQSHDQFYPFYLALVEGNTTRAISMMEKLTEKDPLAPRILNDLAMIQYFDRQYDAAITTCDKILAIDSADGEANRIKSLAAYMKGQYKVAYESCLKAVDAGDSWAVVQMITIMPHLNMQQPEIKSVNQRVENMFKELNAPPIANALVSVSRDEKDAAFDWLDKAYEHEDFWLASLKVDPLWDPLRRDARFQKLIDRMNFPQ